VGAPDGAPLPRMAFPKVNIADVLIFANLYKLHLDISQSTISVFWISNSASGSAIFMPGSSPRL
jgi:hypothetical protein